MQKIKSGDHGKKLNHHSSNTGSVGGESVRRSLCDHMITLMISGIIDQMRIIDQKKVKDKRWEIMNE